MRPITARDLMNPEVLTVQASMSVRELATFLVDNEISGAPVEDADGKLGGVVSLIDIAAASSGGERTAAEPGNPHFYVRGWEDRLDPADMQRIQVADDELTVGDILTPALFTVPEDASVSEIASAMLDGHLHRLLVTGSGDESSVVGILTTSDLLGLLVEEKDP